MRFTEIPDAELLELGGVDNVASRMLFGPPEGDTSGLIGHLQVATMKSEAGPPMYSARVELDPGDLELLAAGCPVYVTQYGGVCPISVDIPFEKVRSRIVVPGQGT